MLTCLIVNPFITRLKLKVISDMEPCHLQLLYYYFLLGNIIFKCQCLYWKVANWLQLTTYLQLTSRIK